MIGLPGLGGWRGESVIEYTVRIQVESFSNMVSFSLCL